MNPLLIKDIATRAFWAGVAAFAAIWTADSANVMDITMWQSAVVAGAAAIVSSIKSSVRDMLGQSPKKSDYPE